MENKKIYECIVGSTAYGTNLPSSDIDIKGVYIQPNDKILGLSRFYTEQIEFDKDTTFFEIKRFLELLCSANPTVLEMLYLEEESMIKTKSETLEILFSNKHIFLTEKVIDSFGGMAFAQIKKAKGTSKKMNWEAEKIVRKTPIDFCYIVLNGKTKPLSQYIKETGYNIERFGLVGLNHIPNGFAIYYDKSSPYNVNSLNFKGIAFEQSNDVRLSSVPKEMNPIIECMFFNKDGYSEHCKDYNSYQEWLQNRNESRYVDSLHGQKIDGKNLMHCVRLLDMLEEIIETNTFSVKRNNAEELLNIRKGNVDLQELIEKEESRLKRLKNSNNKLLKTLDFNLINSILLEIRKKNE